MRVLGYDARVPRTALGGEWSGERRQRFLLRPDAEVPLSVDTMIWPSLIRAAGNLPEGVDVDYESSLAARPEQVRAAVRGQDAEIVGITEGDEPLLGEAWILLGWDIADRWLLSGIANCGKDAEEWRPLRQRWVSELNDNNLFADYGAAEECRPEIERLVPEHAPFSVYGLWLWAP
jgi:hypothetical protein